MGKHGEHRTWVWMTLVLATLTWVRATAQQTITFRANDLRDFVGTNLNWAWDGDGLHLSQPGQPSGLMDSLVRALAYSAVRIPGGALARHFDWRLAVGSPRGSDADYSGRPQVMSTGLPELKRFAARYHLEVLYIINIHDDPTKVAQLVDQWSHLPPQGQAPIRYMELGNEDYLDNKSAAGAQHYSDVVLPIVGALKAAHPEIKIGAQLANPLGSGWDEVVYRRLGGAIDFWTWHRYLPYSTYDSTDAYPATIDSMMAWDRDFQLRDAMQTGRRLPIWLTEYNLWYYKGRTLQNVPFQPRYYLLLGDYLYLAVKHGMAGMFKWCLSNPGWQAYADIDFAGTPRATLSLSGMASRLLNQWVVAQDSVAVVPELGESAMHRSLLAGKDSAGTLSFLVQNHNAEGQTVDLPVPGGYSWNSSEGLFEHGQGFWVDRPQPAARQFALQVRPYSITVVTFRPPTH